MSKPTRGGKRQPPGRSVDMSARALAEFEEVKRRQYHERIRGELIQRGAIVEPPQAVERLLEEAAPRFREKGWRIRGDR